jgi:hypothetical protein
MDPWAVLSIAFLITFLVETLTEYLFGTPMDKIPQLAPYKWLLMYIAAIFGVLLAFFYKIDLVALLKNLIRDSEIEATWVGMVLTGLAMGHGSNYLHQLVSQFFPAKKASG